MTKKYFPIILLFLIFYLGLQLFLPVVVEKHINGIIREETESVQGFEVHVSSFPVWDLLFSRIDRLEIRADAIDVKDNPRLQSIKLDYRDVLLDDGKITGENSALNILITEEALSNYIKTKYPELGNFKVQFEPEQVFLEGFLNFFETEIKVQLQGAFRVEEGSKIFFEPGELQVEKLKIPAGIIKNFQKNLNFYFDPSQFEVPINIENIKISSGKLLLLGGIYAGEAGE